MAGVTSRNQPGKREDFSDVIAVIDQKDTPLFSMIPKGKEPANDLFSWQADDYPAPRLGGVVDGKDVTQFENLVGRVKLEGRIQLARRAPMVSTVAQNVEDVAGVGKRKEMAKAITKGLTMIKRDIECTIGAEQDSQADDGVNPYQTRGLPTWIQSTPQADLPVPAKALTRSTSILTKSFADITESDIRDSLMGSLWDETGRTGNFKMWLGRQLKQKISGWTVYYPDVDGQTIVRKFVESDESTVLAAMIDTIKGDFGTIELFTSPWLRFDLDGTQPSSDPSEAPTNLDVQQRFGMLLDIDMLEMRFNQKPSYRPLEDQGGGPRGLIEAIWALVCLNPRGFGKIAPGGL